MRRKITAGLILRKDGRYQRNELIGDKRRTFTAKDPAKVWADIQKAQEEYEEQERQRIITRDSGPLFSVVSDEYQAIVEKMKEGTRRSYMPNIRRAREALGEYRMREIQPYMIAEFLRSPVFEGCSASTVSNQKTVINNIYQFWIDSPKWRGDCNPAVQTRMPRGLPRSKRPPPTEEQVQIVKDHYLVPDALLPVAYLCTGERRGEMLGIQLKDIDFKKRVIHIYKSVEHINNAPHMRDYTKTPAGIRKVPLLSMLAEALEPIRHLPPDTYIIGLDTKPITLKKYETMWQRFWRKYGVGEEVVHTKRVYRRGRSEVVKYSTWRVPVCGHQFRHEYVCMLAMAGVPEEIAIQLVGHANAKMIHEVYMALKPQMLEDARKRLDALL